MAGTDLENPEINESNAAVTELCFVQSEFLCLSKPAFVQLTADVQALLLYN